MGGVGRFLARRARLDLFFLGESHSSSEEEDDGDAEHDS